ncbi:MAG: WD40 repeat domain-containing protein [Blastocatellia bacterium]|nr:WD40 repeat domain-containing protein [Blastocatellia bacterium]
MQQLFSLYNNLDKKKQQAIASLIKDSKDLRFAQFIEFNSASNLATRSDKEWQTLIELKIQNQLFDDLWKWVFQAPPRWSSEILAALEKANFQPSEISDQELFQQLSQLRPVSGKNLTFFTISSLHELTGNWFNPSLAISPDGSMLIIGNDRGAEAQIWKIPEWKCYATFCGASESMAFSADGKTLATAISRDYYNLDVWDLSKIELNQHSLKNCYKCSKVCEGKFCQYCGSPSPEAPQLQKSSHKTTMKLPAGIAFSPDCKILLAISPNKTVELINTTTWHRQTKFKINECYNCAISPNFRFLATAGDLRFWDLKTGNAYPVLMPHTSVVAFSPDGSILATGHSAEARLWDVDTQKCIDILRIPDSASLNLVSSIAISSNKLLALSQQQGNNIFIWDLISQQIKVKLEHSEQVKKLLFSPDSKLLFVVGSSQLKVWKLTYFDSLPLSSMTETEIKQVALLSQCKPNIDLINWKFVAALLGNRIQSFVEVDSDKESIPQYQIIQTKNTNFIDWRAVIAKLKQSKEFDKLWPLVFETPVHLAAEIVDWLKQCNYRPVNEQDRKNFEKLSSLIPDQSQLPLYTPLPVFRKSLRACPTIISSDNKIIATLDYQGKLSLWDAETNEHIATLSGHKHIINKALFSPDNSKIATSEHWTVSLWDLVAQKWKWKIDRFEATEESAEDPFYGIKIHYEELDYLVFSPNSKIIAIWSRNKAISLYDTDTGKLLCYLTKTESVFKVSFSPDSSLLLLKAFRNIQICQTTTGKLYAPLLIECNTFAFIPNTNFLIIQEKTKISQWDLNNGKECIKVKELEIKPLLYDWIIFSKDNNSFALIDRNLTVQIYNLASFQLQSVTTTSELYQSALWANPSITEHNFVNTFPFTMQLLNQELIYYPKRKEQELYDHLCVDSDKHSANSYFLRLDGQEYLPNHLTLSPDYTMLVLGTEKFLHLWDLNNGTCKLTLAVNRAKSEVFIGSNLLATFSKRLQIWDINTACLQLDFPIDERQMVKLWPDSKNIIITKETKFERWNIDRLDYKSIKQESLYSIFFKSNDERFLVTLQKNNSIKLWDLYLEKCLLTIGDCSPNDFNCWFSSDNQLFWVLPKSFKLHIYNIETSELRIWEHKKENYGHTLSPDGQLLVIWGISNSFWLWRLSTGDCQEFSWSENGITEEVYGRPKNQGCVRVKWLSKVGVFSPCSKKIAFQTEVFEDNTHKTTRFNTYIWDIVSGRGTKVLNQKLCSLDFSTSPFSFDSKWLGTINSVNDTTLSLIDVNDAKNSFSLNVGFQIKGVIFSPDNQTIAISGEQDVQILVNGKTKLKLKDHTLFSKYGSDIAQLNKANFVGLPNISMFSISGKVLAVWETNGKIINIYDIDSLQPIAKLNDCGSIYLFTFLPNNKAIALNSDFTVLVWQENDFRKG